MKSVVKHSMHKTEIDKIGEKGKFILLECERVLAKLYFGACVVHSNTFIACCKVKWWVCWPLVIARSVFNAHISLIISHANLFCCHSLFLCHLFRLLFVFHHNSLETKCVVAVLCPAITPSFYDTIGFESIHLGSHQDTQMSKSIRQWVGDCWAELQ